MLLFETALLSHFILIVQKKISVRSLRTQTPTIPDLPGLFSLVISQSVRFGGWDLIGGGIVDLAFLLLDTPPQLGGKITPRIAAQHRLGKFCL
jgi:hypothetical protein